MNPLKVIVAVLAFTLPNGLSAQMESQAAKTKVVVTLISQSKLGTPNNYMVNLDGLDSEKALEFKRLESSPLITNVNPVPDYGCLMVLSHYTSAEMLQKKIGDFVRDELHWDVLEN